MTTEPHNMGHMDYIDRVVADDLGVLRVKESTYQGSWKRAGGRSAWFMARRNMDRLLVMMEHSPLKVRPHTDIDTTTGKVTVPLGELQRTLRSEDIFAMIEAAPLGEDGTVLAVLRDLRRYMILVEAEMISRGVVPPPAVAYEKPTLDVYQLIADEKGLSRKEVKDRIRALFYGPVSNGEPICAGPVCGDGRSGVGKDGVIVSVGDDCTWTRPEDNVTLCVRVVDVDENGNPIIAQENSPNAHLERRVLEGWKALRKDNHTRRVPRSPEAGSHHSSLYPWDVTGDTAGALRSRIGDELFNLCYSQRGANHYRLETVITNHNLPKELANVYSLMVSVPNSVWLLKRSQIPADLQDEYPRLQVEMNQFEYDTSPSDYKFMYLPVNEKWILQQCYMEWAVQN